jgi:hypothetical protein
MGGSSSHIVRMHFIKTSWAMKKATQFTADYEETSHAESQKCFRLFLPSDRFVAVYILLSVFYNIHDHLLLI